MHIQMGVNWSQATGTMSHTIPQPSQLAFWVLNSQNWEKSGQKWPKNRHFGVYFGGLTLPGPTMRIQMGVNWSQATGILSHTIPQLSQLALWVLNSQNRKKSGQKWPKNRHFGGSMLSGPLMCIHYVRLQCFHIQGGPKKCLYVFIYRLILRKSQRIGPPCTRSGQFEITLSYSSLSGVGFESHSRCNKYIPRCQNTYDGSCP